MIGKKLAHYEIAEQLGQGGMGEVWLARDTRLAREVAIKLMPPELAADSQRRARFEREAQAVAALNHPNVVTIHAVEEAEGLLFLVMERVQGVTLTRKLPTSGLPLRDFFSLGLQLCEAVAAAHAAGITHRDLKPENVMVDDAGRVKVLDFGLAKLAEEQTPDNDLTLAVQTREGVILGTAAYMSPEQAEGKPVDPRSDVFTLGVILYEMLTGTRPFRGDTHMSTLTSVIRDEPVAVVDLRPELPRQFQRILRRCLEKNPERRYESARGIHYDLEALRDDLVSGQFEPDSPVATVDAGPDPSESLDPMLSRSQPPSASMPPAANPGVFVSGRNRIVVLGIVSVIAALIWWQWPSSPVTPEQPVTPVQAERPLIVVFPFENLGPPEEEYFAAGITEEITIRLAGVEELRVLSRSSATRYDRTGKSVAEIASDLGVDFILEGSIRWQRSDTSASRVRVTPQLVSTDSGIQLWAESFDRSMEEIFEVQAQIAGAVVLELGIALGAPESSPRASTPPTRNLDAYHSYLRAGVLLNDIKSVDPGQLNSAVALLENVVQLDPGFAEAWGQLARANAGMVHFGWDLTPARIERSRVAMERGIELDPENAIVQRGRGFYFYHGLKEYGPAIRSFERSIEIQPGDTETMLAIGYVLRRQGRVGEAMDWIRKAAELSPQDHSTDYDVAETLGLLRRYTEADSMAMESFSRAPDEHRSCELALSTKLLQGDAGAAQRLYEQFPGRTVPFIDRAGLHATIANRDFQTALQLLERYPDSNRSQFTVDAREQIRAWVLHHMQMPQQAEAAAHAALTELAILDAETPGNSNVISSIAITRSLISPLEAENSIEDARRALQLYPASKDTWIRSHRERDLAIVLTRAGHHDEAIELLADLLTRDTNATSVDLLRVSPDYDPLRSTPAFEAVLGN